MEQVYLLNPDPTFAQRLDGNCQRCLDGNTNNTPQIKTLEKRRLEYPEELKFVNALLAKCQTCLKAGKPEGRRITDTHSCMYRGGILPR